MNPIGELQQQNDDFKNEKQIYIKQKLEQSKKSSQTSVIKNLVYAFLALMAWILSGALYLQTQDYKFQIDRRAFTDLNDILLIQIPNFNCIVFLTLIPFIMYHSYQYYKYRQIKDDEIQYKYVDNSGRQKDFSNYVLSYLLIYLTQGLSICLSITFCFKAIEEANAIIDVYKEEFEKQMFTSDSEQIEQGMKVIDDLSTDKHLMNTIIAFNMISILILLTQSIYDAFQLCQSKKTKNK